MSAHRGILRNMGMLFGAAAGAQLFGLLASPFITRLFAPDSFGVLALFLSYATAIGTISCLRYDQALMLPRHDRDALPLLALSFLVGTAIALACAALIHWQGPQFLAITGGDALQPWFPFVPLFSWLVGTNQALRHWLARQRGFGDLARLNLARGILAPLTTIAAGITGFLGPSGLLLGRFVSIGAQSAGMAFAGGKRCWREIGIRRTSRALLPAAKRHWRFPALDTPSVLIYNIGKEIPVFLLTFFLGETVTGYYGLTILVLQAPVALVLAAVGQVLYQHASAMQAAGDQLSGLLEETLRYIITVGLLPAAVLACSGPALFSVFFGSRWHEAGAYAAALAPWLLAMMASNATAVLFRTLERQELDLFINVLLLVVRVLALLVGAHLFADPILAMVLLSLSSVLVSFWRVAILVRLVGARHRHLLQHLWCQLLCALPTILLLLFATIGLRTPAPLTVAVSAFASIPYVVLSVRRDPTLRTKLEYALGRDQ